ncbi:hypothetical protein MRX96_015799 [Rhipicephalus microplus]
MRLPLPVTEGYASGDSQSGAGRRANGDAGSATDARRARRTSGLEVQPLEDLNNAAVPHLRSLYIILEAKTCCSLDQRDAHETLSKKPRVPVSHRRMKRTKIEMVNWILQVCSTLPIGDWPPQCGHQSLDVLEKTWRALFFARRTR